MKTALIIAEGIAQVMLTAENESEKAILKLFADRDFHVECKEGTIYDSNKIPRAALGYVIAKCQGDYLRAYEQDDSVMLVLTPKGTLFNENQSN